MTIISWKGQTFNEIVNGRVKNPGVSTNKFKANPLRIYRRETKATTNNEFSGRMTMDIPGASHVTDLTSCVGTSYTVNINLTERSDERPGSCNSCNPNNFSKEGDALRRVRSSGMNSKKFFTSTKQYLDNRVKSYSTSQYYNIRQGESNTLPGTASAVNNVYASNGSASHCKKYQLIADASFEYQWVDAATFYTVNVPAGFYDDKDINNLLQNKMIANLHYYVRVQGNTPETLMRLYYNSTTNRFEFQTTKVSQALFDSTSDYSVPFDVNGNPSFVSPTSEVVPGIRLKSEQVELINALGFTSGGPTFPEIPIGGGTQDLNKLLFFSSSIPKIVPQYVPLYYKPNNPQYGQQGAVSSSDRITRLKYESITDSAASYANALGSSVANALAYGVPRGGYIDKYKNYPLKRTPKVVNGVMTNCITEKISG